MSSVLTLLRTPRQISYREGIIRNPLYLPATIKHRYWSGDPNHYATRRVHIVRPTGVSVWLDRGPHDKRPIFYALLVDTYCSTRCRFPVDIEKTELSLCPACIRNCKEEL